MLFELLLMMMEVEMEAKYGGKLIDGVTYDMVFV